MKPSDFIHPEDAAALRQMEAIPGFPTLMKKIYALGYEKLMYGTNMASNIRLSERQLPELYKHLPPICKTLGIDEPEFYIEMNPVPNAYTFGDSNIFIAITSGLVEMMSSDELDAVLAHECGHILCHHVLYHSVASYIIRGIDSLGIMGSLTIPIQYAILYWQRKSELSCDRVGCIITSPEIVSSTMARLAGGPSSITKNINLEEWAKQSDEYESIRTDGMWNKALQIGAIMAQDHPFAAVRVREILKWAESEQYKAIRNNIQNKTANTCPSCGESAETEWKYCRHCGYKLK